VIAKMADPVARAAIVNEAYQEYVIVADCVKFTPNLKLINLRYLVWAINCDYVRINAELVSTGTTRVRINLGELKKLKIPYPTEPEQIAIANFLDHETAKIDTLIEQQQKLIQLLKEKRQAVISHAVTKGLNPNAPMKDSGVEWLGEVPEHWSVAKLSYRYEVLLGKMLDDKKITGNFLGAYLRNTDVQWDRINTDDLPQMDFKPDEQERYSVKKGDLLVCEGGEIGRCAIWSSEVPCFYQKALHRLRPVNELSDTSRFMYYHLFNAVHEERFIGGIGKATIAHLPAETFKQYRFVFPPLNEQNEIFEFLDRQNQKFNAIEERANIQIELLAERRTALISAAVTGKIDVRGWQAPSAN
jgi:type I restriction enzyme, S subunit